MLHDIMGIDRALPWLLLAFGTGYLAGSIPFGVLVSKVFGLGDLRKIGSGNIGATNVLRTGNKAAAATTLLLDALKGLIPTVLFLAWGDLAAQAAGLGAFIGHCYPVWLRFKGGKGMATFIGVILGLNFVAGLLVCASWLVAAVITRISSAGALVAAGLTPLWMISLDRWEAVLLAVILTVLVWLRHQQNITRILRGEEPKIGQKFK